MVALKPSWSTSFLIWGFRSRNAVVALKPKFASGSDAGTSLSRNAVVALKLSQGWLRHHGLGQEAGTPWWH